MTTSTEIDSECNCICHFNQNAIVIDLQQYLSDEIANNKLLHDEIDM